MFQLEGMMIWAYKMVDLGLMPAVENLHFKAFPDRFVGLVLSQATAQCIKTGQVELKVTGLYPGPSLRVIEWNILGVKSTVR